VPGIGARQARDDADQRRLAGAVRPQQAEKLALRDIEADAGKRLQRAVALLDAADLDRARQ